MGMIFGWPYALHHFSALQWINTTLWKRFARMLLGVGLAMGIQYLFYWLTKETNDLATVYFFGFALPFFLSSFFIFGLFPVLCKHMHLV